MGGASSASAAPAASAAGGYANPAAMARATIGGTTGSNVAGMGYVPRAQESGRNLSPRILEALGGGIADATRQFGNAVASQQSGAGAPAGGAFISDSTSPFAGLAMQMPQVRSMPLQMAGSRTGGYRI